jgi:putative acetyltransferase
MTANWPHKPGPPDGATHETRRRSGVDALDDAAGPQTRPVLIRPARFGGAHGDAALVRTLMREYANFLNASVGGEHICVESLEAELATLPGAYAEPAGAVLLAFAEDEPAGCVALKPLPIASAPPTERACEMKRLWVRGTFQGRQIGRRLAEAIVERARQRGYTAMYLDTMPRSMRAAYSLYRAMDFVPVERYNDNPTLRQAESLEIAWLRREL